MDITNKTNIIIVQELLAEGKTEQEIVDILYEKVKDEFQDKKLIKLKVRESIEELELTGYKAKA